MNNRQRNSIQKGQLYNSTLNSSTASASQKSHNDGRRSQKTKRSRSQEDILQKKRIVESTPIQQPSIPSTLNLFFILVKVTLAVVLLFALMGILVMALIYLWARVSLLYRIHLLGLDPEKGIFPCTNKNTTPN